MRGFHAKSILLTLILAGLAFPVYAQDPSPEMSTPSQADSQQPAATASISLPSIPATTTNTTSAAVEPSASAIVAASPPATEYSGLATSPPSLVPPPAMTPVASETALSPPQPGPPPVAATTPSAPPAIQPVTQAVDVTSKVDSGPLPEVSPEAVGLNEPGTFDSDIWKGTSRASADKLLSMLQPTRSPVLNDLARRLLLTAAVPPEGTDDVTPAFMALRVAKLAAFGDIAHAFLLQQRADKLIDDATARMVVEDTLSQKKTELCGQIPDLAKSRTGVDWQKDILLCQLVARDNQAAQISFDLLRTQTPHDDIFLQVAEKNVMGGSKTLPSQLTPLNPALLAALRMSDLPLPDSVYGHPDTAQAVLLLDAPAKRDETRLDLAEQLFSRGFITKDKMMALYGTVSFKPDDLATPLSSTATGIMLRALAVQAGPGLKDNAQRVALAAKFMQTAPASAFMLAPIAAGIVGDLKAEATYAADAPTIARIYILSGKTELALTWTTLAERDGVHPEAFALWPQTVLAGMEVDSNYVTDLTKWVDDALLSADKQTDPRPMRENIYTSVLMLDAAGYAVPDKIWIKLLAPPHNERHLIYDPFYMARLASLSAAGRKAESILFMVDAVQDNEISLPVAADITRALVRLGLKTDAAAFAQHYLTQNMKLH